MTDPVAGRPETGEPLRAALLRDLVAWLKTEPEQESLISTSLADYLLARGWRQHPEQVREDMAARLIAWKQESPRRSPSAAFSAGPERQMADDGTFTFPDGWVLEGCKVRAPAPSDGERERLAALMDGYARIDAFRDRATFEAVARLLRAAPPEER